MSDLACWRIGEYPDQRFVLRVHGSEHSLDTSELTELAAIIEEVDNGAAESLGEGYKELCADREAQAALPKGGLLAKLGLQRVPAIKRRSI